jgi:hypothetical protein
MRVIDAIATALVFAATLGFIFFSSVMVTAALHRAFA